MNSVSQELENMRLLFCPKDREVRVHVPVQLESKDLSPGIRKGGWIHMIDRTVELKCFGWAVPARLLVDIRHMQVRLAVILSSNDAGAGRAGWYATHCSQCIGQPLDLL